MNNLNGNLLGAIGQQVQQAPPIAPLQEEEIASPAMKKLFNELTESINALVALAFTKIPTVVNEQFEQLIQSQKFAHRIIQIVGPVQHQHLAPSSVKGKERKGENKADGGKDRAKKPNDETPVSYARMLAKTSEEQMPLTPSFVEKTLTELRFENSKPLYQIVTLSVNTDNEDFSGAIDKMVSQQQLKVKDSDRFVKKKCRI